jgi:hypothetical protein
MTDQKYRAADDRTEHDAGHRNGPAQAERADQNVAQPFELPGRRHQLDHDGAFRSVLQEQVNER